MTHQEIEAIKKRVENGCSLENSCGDFCGSNEFLCESCAAVRRLLAYIEELEKEAIRQFNVGYDCGFSQARSIPSRGNQMSRKEIDTSIADSVETSIIRNAHDNLISASRELEARGLSSGNLRVIAEIISDFLTE